MKYVDELLFIFGMVFLLSAMLLACGDNITDPTVPQLQVTGSTSNSGHRPKTTLGGPPSEDTGTVQVDNQPEVNPPFIPTPTPKPINTPPAGTKANPFVGF